MRISDWSSDVCSSDLEIAAAAPLEHRHARAAMADLAARLDARRNLDLVGVAIGIGNLDHPAERGGREADRRARVERGALAIEQRMPRDMDEDVEIGRASCRESGGQYVSISVVAVSLKKKKR